MKKLFKILMIAFCITGSAFANYLVVTSDQLTSTPQGLFVMVNNVTIPVESIHQANDGYIVAIPISSYATCPCCGCTDYQPGRFCPRCNFPDDDRY